jgi:hypothetical protein
MEIYNKNDLLKICPVCGFDDLIEPPYDSFGNPSNEVCPCCGFEFGFDDSSNGFTYAAYRNQWLKNGHNWFSSERKIKKWNTEILNSQLLNIKKVKHYVPCFVMDKHKNK